MQKMPKLRELDVEMFSLLGESPGWIFVAKVRSGA
jgi:hypothetical protein